MTYSQLAIVGRGYTTKEASDIVRYCVLAMYIPAFFIDQLILYFGIEKIIAGGVALLGMASIIALTGTSFLNFYATLILLSLGWNFGLSAAPQLW